MTEGQVFPALRSSLIVRCSARALSVRPHLHLDGADLDDVTDLERALLAGVDAGPVDEGAVGAVEVLDGQGAFLEADEGVLPGGPDAVRRLLVFEVDVHRLLVGPADEVVALVDG